MAEGDVGAGTLNLRRVEPEKKKKKKRNVRRTRVAYPVTGAENRYTVDPGRTIPHQGRQVLCYLSPQFLRGELKYTSFGTCQYMFPERIAMKLEKEGACSEKILETSSSREAISVTVEPLRTDRSRTGK